jgi:hypothetical protein
VPQSPRLFAPRRPRSPFVIGLANSPVGLSRSASRFSSSSWSAGRDRVESAQLQRPKPVRSSPIAIEPRTLCSRFSLIDRCEAGNDLRFCSIAPLRAPRSVLIGRDATAEMCRVHLLQVCVAALARFFLAAFGLAIFSFCVPLVRRLSPTCALPEPRANLARPFKSNKKLSAAPGPACSRQTNSIFSPQTRKSTPQLACEQQATGARPAGSRRVCRLNASLSSSSSSGRIQLDDSRRRRRLHHRIAARHFKPQSSRREPFRVVISLRT